MNITFPMEEKWIPRRHHSKYISYRLPGGEIMYKEEPTDKIPYAFVRGPIVYSLDMVWNKQLCNDDVNMEQDIRMNVAIKPTSVKQAGQRYVRPGISGKKHYTRAVK